MGQILFPVGPWLCDVVRFSHSIKIESAVSATRSGTTRAFYCVFVECCSSVRNVFIRPAPLQLNPVDEFDIDTNFNSAIQGIRLNASRPNDVQLLGPEVGLRVIGQISPPPPNGHSCWKISLNSLKLY